MKNKCLENNGYFDTECEKWVNNNNANRDDVMRWGQNVCDKMLNQNTNITTASDGVLKKWCETNAKANPGDFDQIMNTYCNNPDKYLNEQICFCYGQEQIPGSTSAVPRSCLGDCTTYGYKSAQMATNKCAIAICNTNVDFNKVTDSKIAIEQITNNCSAQMGDATVNSSSGPTINAGEGNSGTELVIGIQSKFPQSIVNIAVKLGLYDLSKKNNIEFDQLLIIMFIAIFAVMFLVLNNDDEQPVLNNQIPAYNPYNPYYPYR